MEEECCVPCAVALGTSAPGKAAEGGENASCSSYGDGEEICERTGSPLSPGIVQRSASLTSPDGGRNQHDTWDHIGYQRKWSGSVGAGRFAPWRNGGNRFAIAGAQLEHNCHRAPYVERAVWLRVSRYDAGGTIADRQDLRPASNHVAMRQALVVKRCRFALDFRANLRA